jgi:hypothetical protein
MNKEIAAKIGQLLGLQLKCTSIGVATMSPAQWSEYSARDEEIAALFAALQADNTNKQNPNP